MKVFEKELAIWKQYSDNKLVEALPPHLDLELSNRCNLTCEQCPYHGKDKVIEQDPCDMDYDLYKKIIDEACTKNVRSVKLSFSGEPLLYPQFYEAVEYAKKRGLQVNINSNGTLLNYSNAVKLVKSGLDVIIITDYELNSQVLGICVLQAQKQMFKSTTPYIVLKTNTPDKFGGLVEEIVPLVYNDYTKLEDNRARVDFCCGMPWQRLLVLADGSVMSCACGMGLFDMENSYLGNVLHSSLEGLWHSHKINFLRVIHENNESHLVKMCRLCPTRNDIIKRLY